MVWELSGRCPGGRGKTVFAAGEESGRVWEVSGSGQWAMGEVRDRSGWAWDGVWERGGPEPETLDKVAVLAMPSPKY